MRVKTRNFAPAGWLRSAAFDFYDRALDINTLSVQLSPLVCFEGWIAPEGSTSHF